jgi:hypothetical protein
MTLRNTKIGLIVLVLIACWSCEKATIVAEGDMFFPIIDSISVSKHIIEVGGADPSVMRVYATGGGLNFLWDVDLGDIIPQNADASIVTFYGSPCCIGEKFIKCTVTNKMGSVEEIVNITIE